MRSLLNDIPKAGWLITLLIILRTSVLALVIVGFSVLMVEVTARTLIFTCSGIVLAAVLLLMESIVPGRLRCNLEEQWRRKLAEANLEFGPDSTKDDAKIITEATDSTQQASTYSVLFLGPLFAALIAPLFVLIILGAAISWPIAASLLIGVLLIPVIVGWAMKNLRGAGAGYGRASGQLAGVFLESVRKLKTTMILNGGAQRRAKIAGTAERMRSQVMNLLYRNQLMILVTDGAFGLATTTVAAVGVWIEFRAGYIGLGQAVAVVLLSRLFIDPVNRMGRTFYTGMSGKSALAKVRAALDQESPPGNQTGHLDHDATSRQDFSGEVSVRNLTVDRGTEEVVHDIGFELPPGGHLAIVGPSGSGKSTVALALAGLVEFTGTISIGGKPVSASELRNQVAFVPQSTTLFSGTLASNLDLAGDSVDLEKVSAILSTLSLDLDTPIGEQGRGVSGGEAARISIARALLKNAKVLVLDEATANLDVGTAREIRDLARATTMTLVEVTHRPIEALDAETVLVLEHGRVTALDSPSNVSIHSPFFALAVQEEK